LQFYLRLAVKELEKDIDSQMRLK